MTGEGDDRALRAADDRARREAQREFVRPLVLEAGAGTGKTATLVARVLAWALGPGWERAAARTGAAPVGASREERERVAADGLGRVAAITFTEAAAAEMAERVGAALHGLQRGAWPPGLLPEAVPDDAAERDARARALLASLDHLRVSTIHAFCRRLLARNPIAAGLHPRFQVDASERAVAQVVREVVEETLRDSYRADGGSEDLLRLAADGFGPPEVHAALLQLVREGVAPEELEADPFAPARVQARLDALGGAVASALAAEGGALAAVGGNALAPRVRAALAATGCTLRDPLEPGAAGLAALCERLAPEWPDNFVGRLRDWSRAKFSAGEEDALGAASEAFAQAIAEVAPRLRALLRVRPQRLETARRALVPLLARTTEELRRRGVATYASLLRDARAALRSSDAVRRRERRSLDQLLVDEFQDTDPVQCDLVRALALEGGPDERPGLFLVGDPKQSIYGWRSADLRAYDAFVEDVERAGGTKHVLYVNWRSAPPILDEVTRAVGPVMRREPGRQPAFQPLVPCDERRGAPGFAVPPFAPVEYWASWSWDAAAGQPREPRAAEALALEARALARDLCAVHERGVPWRECAVLLRTTPDLEAYLAELRAAGVPYAVERDRSYYQRREVIDAAALVRCVLDPNDHLALLTFLRSSAVGVPDAALLPLWSRQLPRRVTELHGPDPEKLAALAELAREVGADLEAAPTPGIARVRGWEESLVAALESLAAARDAFEREPPDRFVELVRTLFLFEQSEAARHLGGFRAANLERFFRELAAELAESGDAHALLRRLRASVAEGLETEEERPPASDRDAVRVMTVHKAKGLDFGHVYLVQCHKGRSGRSEAAAQAGRSDGGLEVRLFDAATPGLVEVELEREAVDRAESVRALYVAMTRAKERVVLVGRWSRAPQADAAPRGRSFADLLEGRLARAGATGRMARGVAESGGDRRDADGARWVFPALAGDLAAPPTPPGPDGPALPAVDAVAAEERRLRARRERALARMARPWRGAASEEVHADEREGEAARRFGEADAEPGEADAGSAVSGAVRPDASPEGPSTDAAVAAAAGTAVHRVLEELDLGADLAAELSRGRTRLASLLAERLPAEAAERARARADAALERLARGALAERLARVAPHVLARELPVWLPPEPAPASDVEAGAVACIAGAIDLLYRDPDTGELVVVDWKTDAVEDEAALAERRARYAGQGARYARAVQGALGLDRPPRFELWFLHAGRVK